MNTATHTITRYTDGVSKVTLVKGRDYSDEQLAALPIWYKEYTQKAS